MSKLAKKFATIATVITVLAMVIGPVAPAQALDVADLQTQIAALQAQIVALNSQLGTVQNTTSGTTGIPAVCAGISFSRNLARNAVGADVKCLQALLNQLNVNVADAGAGSPGHETTFFGGATRVAVIRFQELYKADCLTPIGLTVGTGYVGTLTRAKLNAILAGGGTVTPPVGGGTTPPVVVNGVVTASLASDNPASAPIVADTTSGDGAQAMISVLKVNLSNGTASPINVSSMKFTRSGISADSDISQAYLYDGDTRIAEYSSFSQAVLAFNAASLFTIPANSVKTITLKVDLANGTGSGKTIKFGINVATDIVSNASSIGGTFPITGNVMSTATTADLGKLTVTVQATNPASVDPGTGVEVMKFTLAAADQKIQVQRIVFNNVGTVAYTDLTNFQLLDAATPIGSVVASANADKTVVVTLATPLVIEKGNSKNMTLKADVVGGTNRTFKFSFQYLSDIVAYDTQYGIYLKPNQSSSWTVLNAVEATISSGKVSASKATDSPSGNLSASSTNQTLAKFTLKASGEDVKITDLTVQIYGTIGSVGMYQTSVYYDGAQVGQTTTTMNTQSTAQGGTVFSFGNTLVLPAGTEKVIEIKSDVKNASGGSIAAASTLTAKISSFTATGKTSGASVTIGALTGNQLTVSSGIVTVTMNQAQAHWTAANPTGVAGAPNVLIGSFSLKAGSGEGANVTAISVQIASTSAPTTANTEFQNVRLYKGTLASGVQLGSPLTNSTGIPTASTTYTVYPVGLSLAKGESIILNVYADILSGADTNNARQIVIGPVYATGQTTNTSVDSAGWVSGQKAIVSSGGYLGILVDNDTPDAGLALMNTTGVEFAKFRFSASSSPESISVTSIVATTTLVSATVNALSNITLTSSKNPSWSVRLDSLDSNGVADFSDLMSVNPLVIAKGLASEDVITLKADVAPYDSVNMPSGSTIAFGIKTATWKGQGDPLLDGVGVAGETQTFYLTKPTVTLLTSAGAPATGMVSRGTFSDVGSVTFSLIKFRVAADAKGQVDLNRVNLNLSVYDSATSTSNLTITKFSLYRAGSSTVLNDVVSIATSTSYIAYSASSTVAASKFGGTLTGDPLSKSGNILLSNAAGTALASIAAGTYTDFEVKVAIANVSTDDTMSVSLDNLGTDSSDQDAIKWGDTITNVIPATYLTGVPTDSWSWSNR